MSEASNEKKADEGVPLQQTGANLEKKPDGDDDGEQERTSRRCCGCGSKPMPEGQKLGQNLILERRRWCTDIHMLIVFLMFWFGMIMVMSFAWEEGDKNVILYGYDWKGDVCNEENEGGNDMLGHDRQYWPNPLYYNEMGAVCLKSSAMGTGSGCPENLPPKIFGAVNYSQKLPLVCVCNPKLYHGEDVANTDTVIGAACQTNNLGSTWGYVTVEVDIDPATAMTSTGNHLKDWWRYMPNEDTMAPLPLSLTPPACTPSELNPECAKTRVPLCAPAYKCTNALNRCMPYLSAEELEDLLLPPECRGGTSDVDVSQGGGGALAETTTSYSISTTISVFNLTQSQFEVGAVRRAFRGTAAAALYLDPSRLSITSPAPPSSSRRTPSLTITFEAYTDALASATTVSQFAAYLTDDSSNGFASAWARLTKLVYTTISLPAVDISVTAGPTAVGPTPAPTTPAPTTPAPTSTTPASASASNSASASASDSASSSSSGSSSAATPAPQRRLLGTAADDDDPAVADPRGRYWALGVSGEWAQEAERRVLAEGSTAPRRQYRWAWQHAWMELRGDVSTRRSTVDTSNCPSDEFKEAMGTGKQWAQDTFADLEKSADVMLGMLVVSVCLGFAYLYFMRFCAVPIVWGTLLAVWVCLAMMVTVLYWNYENVTEVVNHTPQLATYDADVRNQKISLAFLIIVAMLWAVHTAVIVFLRDRISVACRLLSLAAESLTDMPYLVFYPIGQAVICVLYFILFIAVAVLLASAGTLQENWQYGVHEMSWDEDLSRCFIYWIFGLFWTIAFVEAVGFMVLAFCVCMWFFAPRPEGADADSDEREIPDGVLNKAINFTVCRHLGTVATGSLIIAVIRMLRLALEYIDAKQKELNLEDKPCIKYIMCLLKCFAWCLEKCARWMSKKVYIETCIHGTWFCTSLCQVAVALVSMISYISVAEFITGLMMFFGNLSIALATTVIGGYILNTRDLTSVVFPGILVCIMGFMVAAMFVEVYDMCCDTMLMCFCEAKLDPDAGICVPKQLESFMGDQYNERQQEIADADASDEALEGLSPALLEEMREKFARYDLDASGTINSQEELQQLMTNLYFALSSKVDPIKPDVIVSRVQAAGTMNWSFNEWAAWCKGEFPEICKYEG